MASGSGKTSGLKKVTDARDVALGKLPDDPRSKRSGELRRRVRKVAEAYQDLDAHISKRIESRAQTETRQKAARTERRLAAERTLADTEKQLRASQRSGDREAVARDEAFVISARANLNLIDSVARYNESADRLIESRYREQLIVAVDIAVTAIESVHRTDGAERFQTALKGAVAVGTIAGGFAYPVLAAAVSAVQAAIDLLTGSSTKRRLRREDLVAARQEAAIVFLKVAEELLTAWRQQVV
jgi:hypothetical protein